MNCKGCGNIKQIKNKNDAGYCIDLNHDYCFFCFKILNYNKDLRPNSIKISLEHKFPLKSILFLVTTIENFLFDINLIQKYKNNTLNLIINKSDKYLRIWNKTKILNFINKYLTMNNIQIQEIFIISCNKNNGIDKLNKYILNNRKNHKYLIGNVNVGKSSISNKIAQINNIEIKNLISKYNNTTQKSLCINELNLYDTPGLEYKIYAKEINNTIFNKYEWKQFVYQNNQTKTININDLILINLFSNDLSNIVLYMNKNIKLNNCNFDKWITKNDISLYKEISNEYKNEIWIIIENIGFIRLKSINIFTIKLFIKKDFKYKIIKGNIWE